MRTGRALRVLATTNGAGGTWQYSLGLARGLSRIGVDTLLAVLGPEPSAAQAMAADAIEGLELVGTGLALAGAADGAGSLRATGDELAELAIAHGADLVQLGTPAIAAQSRFPVPIVAVHHRCAATWWEAAHGTALPPEFAPRSELIRAGLEAAHIVVTPTAAFGAATQRVYGLPEPPRTVHHGLTPLPVQRSPHDVAVAVPLEGPNGVGVMFDNVHSLDTVDEAAPGDRPVFVSTALYEPFGFAVLEAAASGCPLILSDIPTFRELWDGVAVFVDPRDEQGFTRAIADLVADAFGRAAMGRAARQRAALYTADAMAAQMAAIYRSLLPPVRRPVLAARAVA